MPSRAGVLSSIPQTPCRVSDTWCCFTHPKEAKQVRLWRCPPLSGKRKVPGARRGISTTGKVGRRPVFLFKKLHWSEVLSQEP